MNYEKDIKIDAEALDLEWLEQPQLMLKYCQHAADMRYKLDAAKEALDLARAELDKEIRTNPERFGIGKVTESVVENTILMQPEYREASEAMANAKYESDVAQNAVRAIDQRKDALENLVRLFGLQYFAGPRVPRDLSQEVQKRAEQRQANEMVGPMRRRT
jgi:hypothetical protein